MIDKFTKKYMKMAKTLAEDNDACYSRKIGVVIISENNTPISFGYNGSIRKAPHNDSKEYLEHLYNDLLLAKDLNLLAEKQIGCSEDFVNKYENCKICPRKILGCQSGERLDLCNCAHAERNALANANVNGTSTKDATMYCYCALPCHECSVQIIQAQIAKIVCLKADLEYSKSSRWLFAHGNVKVLEIDEALINT
jgi:deoxycytidylate deaminase